MYRIWIECQLTREGLVNSAALIHPQTSISRVHFHDLFQQLVSSILALTCELHWVLEQQATRNEKRSCQYLWIGSNWSIKVCKPMEMLVVYQQRVRKTGFILFCNARSLSDANQKLDLTSTESQNAAANSWSRVSQKSLGSENKRNELTHIQVEHSSHTIDWGHRQW